MMTANALLTLLLFSGMGCTTPVARQPAGVSVQPAAAAQEAPRMTVLEPAAALGQLADPQATVLDVRTPEEFATGHLERARNMNLRASDFSEQVAGLDPNGRYVLYCASGNRSSQAAAIMQKIGFTNLVNAGGYSALKAAGAK